MFHLTSQERKTVIFVLALLVLGIGLDFINKNTNRADLINLTQEQLFEKVDINQAKFSELSTIPNLGEKIVQSIIDYRKSHSCFKSIEELKQIKGIKDKKLEQFKKYIILGPCPQ